MTDIWLYGIVGEKWDGLDAASIAAQISASDDDLTVRINSPGGYVIEGLAIFNILAAARGARRRVTVRIDSLAASMASVIAMVGDEIIMADNALMMIHNPWDCACGDARELRRAADQLDLLRDQILKIYAARSGMTADALIPLLDAETWLTADEAKAQNFITGISTFEADTSRIAAMAMGRPQSEFNIEKFGFRKAPVNHQAMRNIVWSTAAAAAFFNRTGVTTMTNPTQTAAQNQPAVAVAPATGITSTAIEASAVAALAEPVRLEGIDARALADQAVADERARIGGINALAAKHGLDAQFANALVAEGVSLDTARSRVLDRLAESGDRAQVGGAGGISVTADEREKWVQGASNWIVQRSGIAGTIAAAAKARGQSIDLSPGEFRGARMVDLARDALARAGVSNIPMDRDQVMKMALTSGGARASIGNGTSDFTILLENVMHKTLQAAYATAPDTWSRFCGIGSVMDFRPHSRYLLGTLAALQKVNENGEFKQMNAPDAAKETITAETRGGMISITRQALINDDLSGITTILMEAGRAAKLTIENEVYALLAANPVMNDGIALFHASHGNLAGTGTAPSVTSFDALRQAMAVQKDVSGNEFLSIVPQVGLFPVALSSLAKVINGSVYDPDANNKLQRANAVAGMFADIVESPRATGTAWYGFADPALAPAIEVAFLDGVQEPYTESRDGWTIDGIQTKVRHDYAIGAVNWRSAQKNPGA